ncbi:MAG: hypothetical protein IPL28_26455 [Chloroflexi bacterium]|nr:hypothetical protein [Chloroflexota bacterium]
MRVVVHSPEATLTLPLMLWSGWEATAAGQPIELTAARGSGLATATLPEGSHT